MEKDDVWNEYLSWPSTGFTKENKKIKKETEPFAIVGHKWREIHQKRKDDRIKKEIEIQERKKLRQIKKEKHELIKAEQVKIKKEKKEQKLMIKIENEEKKIKIKQEKLLKNETKKI